MTINNSPTPPERASSGAGASARRDPASARDFADTIPDAVEGRSELAQPQAHPKEPAVHAADEKYDRSAILGHDGRVIAGWALRFIVIIAALYLLGRLLGAVWVGLFPVILAILLATVLWPATRFLRNHGFPAALASILTLIVSFGAIVGIFAAMAPTVRSQGSQLIDQARAGTNQIVAWLQDGPLNLDLGRFNLDELINNATNFLRDQSGNIATGVFTGLSAATSILVTLFVTFVITFFILKDGDKFLPMLRKYTGANAGWHLSEVLTRTWQTLSGFIQTQALVSAIDAFFIGLGLVILQVPIALILATVTFFAGFIPIVGAVTAGALAVIIALVTQGVTNALIVLAIILAVQQLEGNILQPVLQSKAMNLHAAVVLLSVTVGSTLFGIAGAFLAVPIAATLAVWIRYHSEMVSLRAGEITVDDIEIATAKGQTLTSREAFNAVRDHLKQIAVRRRPAGSTAASKVKEPAVARVAAEPDKVQDPHGPDGSGEWLDQPYDKGSATK
ncbi:AI-2E family transporter [Corynebacterium doosanense]|uniref:Membrane protein n=1 Tax=Corynebacterium doosanense CAU 212 = DSM 45436 TaxID=558173 RepID=A0A097IIJ8_9CORY|nr:AI-2E family transporter [Corynebacterium doosanense]AIT61948.1 membrane protein [Corynebacterium doosanense CAU 212 = DSM 45436]